MDFEFTYYQHELDATIQALDAQTQLDRCVQTLDPASCNGITRNQVGAINSFSNILTNLGGTDTEGYDFLVHYLSPEWGFGQIDVQWLSTYVDSFTKFVPTSTGFQSIGLVGIEENDSGIPRWLSSLITNWNLDRWNVAWTMRYIHKIEESCSDFLDGTPNSFAQLGLCSQPNFANEPLSVNKLGSTVYHDLQAVFEIGDFGGFDTSVSFGIINAFDKDPPICHSCSLNGYDASLYNVPGQFWYARVGLSR
ncbi:MAG: TonB-dependent receptor, partial [Gammaproteobacteria bacterium]